jgi:cell wall-associated NlpC family hydrolase
MAKGRSAQLLILAVGVSLLSACASTGGTPVPKPFPTPGPSTRRATPPVPSPAAPVEPAAAPTEPAAPTGPKAPGLLDAYALVGTALHLRGTPYRDGGSDLHGFDCSGFTQYVFAQYGVGLPRAVRDQYKIGSGVRSSDLQPGDLLFFTTTEPGASHVAIVVGSDEFVHAPSSAGVVRVERLSSAYWSQRLIGARRVH